MRSYRSSIYCKHFSEQKISYAGKENTRKIKPFDETIYSLHMKTNAPSEKERQRKGERASEQVSARERQRENERSKRGRERDRA